MITPKKSLLISIIMILAGAGSISYVYSTDVFSGTFPQIEIDGKNNTKGAAYCMFGNNDTKLTCMREVQNELQFMTYGAGVYGHLTKNGIWVVNSIIPMGTKSHVISTGISPSTSNSSWTSTGFGTLMESNYLSSQYGSGVSVQTSLMFKSDTDSDCYQVALFRSYVGIPSSGSPLNTGDLLLSESPDSPYICGAGWKQVSPQFTDVGNNNSTQYYYLAFRAINGTVTLSDHMANIKAWVT